MICPTHTQMWHIIIPQYRVWRDTILSLPVTFFPLEFTDWREIWHKMPPISQTGLLKFWDNTPRDGKIVAFLFLGCRGICILLIHLFYFCVVDAEESDKVKSLKDTMLLFCRIQRDMEQVEATAMHVINQVQDCR